MKRYNLIVLGFTFLGSAAALRDPENSLIIERTTQVCREFTDTLNERPCLKKNFETKAGNEFYSCLKKRGYIDDGGNIYAFAAAAELAKRVLARGIRVLFLTELVSIRKTEDGFSVTVFNVNGENTFFAKRVIDTTSESTIKDMCIYKTAKKYLNALTKEPASFHNPLTGINVFSLPVDMKEDIVSARKRLIEQLKTLKNSALYIGSFSYEMPFVKLKSSEGYYIVPSCGCDNLLEAFDKGAAFDEK